jgi:hypothetical protein
MNKKAFGFYYKERFCRMIEGASTDSVSIDFKMLCKREEKSLFGG